VGDPRTSGDPDRRKQAQHRLTTDEAARLVAEYEAGGTIHGLARRFNLRRETVRDHLARHGVEQRPHGLTAEQVAEVTALYADGWTFADLGRRFGVEPRTVSLALRRAGQRSDGSV
jgi:DNA-directed RNA polymerase specialized sigma24 family protein